MNASMPGPGDLFERYRIDHQLGFGGMGVVHAATDTRLGRQVALKLISGRLAGSDEFRRRFQREAAILARLDSPHVITIFDHGEHLGIPYIATQYVAGGSVGDLLRRGGPLPPRLAVNITIQVAEALHDAHRAGVVHRDVKPDNVLLREGDLTNPHAYLCDFGIAQVDSEGFTASGSVSGTWNYLSPERARGMPGTPASDIYALGCLLWAMLTSEPPYAGPDLDVALAHQSAPVPQLAGTDAFSPASMRCWPGPWPRTRTSVIATPRRCGPTWSGSSRRAAPRRSVRLRRRGGPRRSPPPAPGSAVPRCRAGLGADGGSRRCSAYSPWSSARAA